MSQVGKIKRAYEIGYTKNDLHRYIYLPCPDCGNEHWVELLGAKRKGKTWWGGEPELKRCRSCALRILHTKNTKTGKIQGGLGYTIVRILPSDPFYPMAKKKGSRSREVGIRERYILEHRLVMARHLGRLLTQEEQIHHINGIKTDNRVENLIIVNMGKHKKTFAEGYREGFKDATLIRDKALEKQIKLLQWEIKELGIQLQLKLLKENQ